MKRIFSMIALLLPLVFSACAPKTEPSEIPMPPEVSTTLPEHTVSPAAGGTVGQSSLPTTITMSENGKTFTAKVGDSFLLNLGDDVYNWEVSVDSQDVLALKKGVAVVKGAQGIFDALESGTAVLTAVGNPKCLDETPPCMMPTVLWKVTVIVR